MGAKYVFNPLTGNLDTTDVVAFNGEVNLGTAAAPSVFFTGDTNTGIYSPGANQLAISTNGTGRLFINSNGNVGVGVSPGVRLHSYLSSGDITLLNETGAGASRLRLRTNNQTNASYNGIFSEYAGTTNDWFIRGGQGSGNILAFGTNNTERLRITSDGKLGLGTSSPLGAFHGAASSSGEVAYVLQNSSSSSTATSTLYISNGTIPTTRGAFIRNGILTPGSSDRYLAFGVNNIGQSLAEIMRLTPAGLGIGTTSPSTTLHVAGSTSINSSAVAAAALTIGPDSGAGGVPVLAFSSSNTSAQRIDFGDPESTSIGRITYSHSNNSLTFRTNASDAATIDSSGRLLVGTSNSVSTNCYLQLLGNPSNNAGSELYLGRREAATTPLTTGQSLGHIRFGDNAGSDFAGIAAVVDGSSGLGDCPGRLLFSSTPSGSATPVERMRITSDAYVRLASGSGGIQFNGDTAAANALDDYEEGTWTPVIAGQTTAGTGTYSTQVGRYTKVGKLVHCVGTLIWTAHTGTGNMRIEGLPFNSLSVSELFNAAVFAYVANITMPANTTLMGDMSDNTSRITLRSVLTGGGTPSALAMDSAGNIYFSITYQTD